MVNRTYRKKIAMAVMAAALVIQAPVLAEEPETEPLSEVPQETVVQTDTPAPAAETEAPPQTEEQTEAPAPQTEETEAQTEAPAAPQAEETEAQTEAPAPQTEETEAQTEAPAPQTEETEAQTEAPAPQTEETETETEAPAPQTEETEAQTEAPAPQTEETEAETEAPAPQTEQTEASQTEASEAEETVDYKTDFYYESDEVIVTAKASEAAKLPEGTEMKVYKLEEGTAEFNAMKQAAEANCGASETAEYKFYGASFVFNGEKLNPAGGTVSVQVQFKTVQVDAAAKTQKVLQIKEGRAKDVTAVAAEGSSMSSLNFEI